MAKMNPQPVAQDDPPEGDQPPVEPGPTGDDQVEVVVYLNIPGTRVISSADWAAAGQPDHPDTVWNAQNKWTVRMDSLDLDEGVAANVIVAANGLQRLWVAASEAPEA